VLADFHYVGPGRQFSSSALGINRTQIPATLSSAEDVATALAYQRELERRVSNRCREIFEYGVEIQNIPNGLVDVEAVDKKDRPVSAVNMGSGFNQVAWLATVLESRLMSRADEVGSSPCAGVEEPELHLHPAAQSKIARLLRIYADAGVQILCTTHSEHLLKALLRLVLGGDLHSEQLRVVYIDQGKAEPLEVDELGRLQGGLRGFFETNEQELNEHLDLLIDKAPPDNPSGG
jgi:predicted ATPase